MPAVRLPDRTDDLRDVHADCRVDGRAPRWDAGAGQFRGFVAATAADLAALDAAIADRCYTKAEVDDLLEGFSGGPDSTDELPEGTANLYHTAARVDARIAAATGVTVAAQGHSHSAGDLTSGTLADGRLSNNVPLKNSANTFAALVTFTAGAAFGPGGNLLFSNANRGISYSADGMTYNANQGVFGKADGSIELVIVGGSVIATHNAAVAVPGYDVRLFSGSAGSSSVYTALRAKAHPLATPGVGFGSRHLFQAGSSTVNYRDQAEVMGCWAVATDATRRGRLALLAYDTVAAREGLRIEADGTQALVGFFGGAAVARGAAVANADGTLASATAQLNLLLTRIRALNLIAP